MSIEWKHKDKKHRSLEQRANLELAGLKEPPARFAAGAEAVQTLEAKATTLLAQANAHRELSSSLAFY